MYNKLFTKILDSSIWLESMPTRLVWLTFIAAMDEVGFAQFAAVANVAHRARVSPDEAEEAIRCLESPDPNSSDQDFEGRRIERVPGGWLVLNADKHRAMVTKAIIQEQTRLRVRRFRERLKRTRNEQVTTSEAVAVARAEKEKSRTHATAAGPLAGTLPRDHVNCAFCGTRFCVSRATVSKMARAYGEGGDGAVLSWLESFHAGLSGGYGGPVWLLQHWDAHLVEIGHVTPAPAPRAKRRTSWKGIAAESEARS